MKYRGFYYQGWDEMTQKSWELRIYSDNTSKMFFNNLLYHNYEEKHNSPDKLLKDGWKENIKDYSVII